MYVVMREGTLNLLRVHVIELNGLEPTQPGLRVLI